MTLLSPRPPDDLLDAPVVTVAPQPAARARRQWPVAWYLRKAYRDITRRKIRSALTIIGIVIGVAGVVAIISSARNLTAAQQRTAANSSAADMTWWLGNAPPTLTNAIGQIPDVAAANSRATFYTKYKADDQWRDALVIGIDDYSASTVNTIEVVEGRLPGKGEVALEASARALTPQLRLGDMLGVRGSDNKAGLPMVVVGWVRSPALPSAAILNLSPIYAGAADVRRLQSVSGDNQLLVRVDDLSRRDEVKRQIESLFRKRNIQFGSYVARDPDNFLGKRELDTLVLLMLVFSALGLLISASLVANTLSAIVTEQVSEIGALKALGASRRQVLTLYLAAALIYGVFGTLLGLVAGQLLGAALLGYLGEQINVDVRGAGWEGLAVGIGVGVGMGMTLVGALVPAWIGARIPARQALDSFGISHSYGRGLFERLLVKFRRIPPAFALAVRNLGRRKTRNAITAGVIALACAAFLIAQVALASVNETIGHIFEVYGNDGWVWFDGGVSPAFEGLLRAQPGIETAEAWGSAPAFIKGTRVGLMGVPTDTRLYKKPVVVGSWFAGTDDENRGALVSTNFATTKGLRIGDTIEIEAQRYTVRMVVIGLLDDNAQNLGSSSAGRVFISRDAFSRLLHTYGRASFFAVRTAQHDKASVDRALTNIEARFRDLRPSTEPVYVDIQSSEGLVAILRVMLIAMVVIVGAMGALGIVNTLTLNIMERRREIGILRVLGSTNARLLQIFVTEGLLLGVLGLCVGILTGIPLSKMLVDYLNQTTYPVRYVFQPAMVGLTALFCGRHLCRRQLRPGARRGAHPCRPNPALRLTYPAATPDQHAWPASCPTHPA